MKRWSAPILVFTLFAGFLTLAGLDDEDRLTEVVLGDAVGYTEGVTKLLVEGRDAVRSHAGLPLWWVGDEPGALLLKQGQGRVLVVADPSLLTLRGLRRADNARFLVNTAALHAQDGRVYFDEYHHGLRSGGGLLGYLHEHHRVWILLPLLALLVVAA